ncbi:hypothetical protein [Leucobacter sp. Psy1]|uniref:hypothetical protein n=1 Tax=Leucobacter sp. Psy1 TaxID=2875729 RepID=UPI001CD7CE25|nr:hypothetical protein [Leucobacter sp. Psy1]
MQQTLYGAVHDFYQTYYSTLSALSSLYSRFRDILGEVPHRSNEKFLNWLEPRALGGDEAMSLLREAREYRNLLDHKASHQPYDWVTFQIDNGPAVVALHGASSQSGKMPDGAKLIESLEEFSGLIPTTSDWMVFAPDEDRVLTSLAVQMNAVFPLIGASLVDVGSLKACSWTLTLSESDPQSGYPIYAASDGELLTSRGDRQPGASFGL